MLQPGVLRSQHRSDPKRQFPARLTAGPLHQLQAVTDVYDCGRLGRGALGQAVEASLLACREFAGALRDVQRDRRCCSFTLVGKVSTPAWQVLDDIVDQGNEVDGGDVNVLSLMIKSFMGSSDETRLGHGLGHTSKCPFIHRRAPVLATVAKMRDASDPSTKLRQPRRRHLDRVARQSAREIGTQR